MLTLSITERRCTQDLTKEEVDLGDDQISRILVLMGVRVESLDSATSGTGRVWYH